MILRTFCFLAFAATTWAQANIHMKDGRVVPAKQLRREKDTIIATVEIPAQQQGGQPTKGDFGFPLAEIATLQFAKPAVLDLAPTLIAQGKAEQALEQLQPVLRYYEGFRDAPGSWWIDAVPLHIQALLALRRDAEASEEAAKFSRMASDPENQKLSRIFTGVALTRKGSHQASLSFYDEGSRNTRRLDMLGLIAVNKGDTLVALGDELKKKGEVEKAMTRYEEALLSYLRIPALYPSQTMYMPQALLGSARAYLGIEDFGRARDALRQLREGFPSTAEAKEVDALTQTIEKLEKQIEDPAVNKPSA